MRVLSSRLLALGKWKSGCGVRLCLSLSFGLAEPLTSPEVVAGIGLAALQQPVLQSLFCYCRML